MVSWVHKYNKCHYTIFLNCNYMMVTCGEEYWSNDKINFIFNKLKQCEYINKYNKSHLIYYVISVESWEQKNTVREQTCSWTNERNQDAFLLTGIDKNICVRSETLCHSDTKHTRTYIKAQPAKLKCSLSSSESERKLFFLLCVLRKWDWEREKQRKRRRYSLLLFSRRTLGVLQTQV